VASGIVITEGEVTVLALLFSIATEGILVTEGEVTVTTGVEITEGLVTVLAVLVSVAKDVMTEVTVLAVLASVATVDAAVTEDVVAVLAVLASMSTEDVVEINDAVLAMPNEYVVVIKGIDSVLAVLVSVAREDVEASLAMLVVIMSLVAASDVVVNSFPADEHNDSISSILVSIVPFMLCYASNLRA